MKAINFSTCQDAAAQKFSMWLLGDRPFQKPFLLFGFAGTGKTFLLGYLLNEVLPSTGRKVHICTPTHKAGLVLQRKINEGGGTHKVQTIHSLLYSPFMKKTKEYAALLAKYQTASGEKKEQLKKKIDFLEKKKIQEELKFQNKDEVDVDPNDIIVVDESSMVSVKARDDLMSTGASILFVGDPGQLPPVQSTPWMQNSTPDSMLKTVQRQSLESPIIRLSMDIRNGRPRGEVYKEYQGDDCKIFQGTISPQQMVEEFDQVICGKNAIRRTLNVRMREHLGRTGYLPKKDDKIISCHNMFDRANRTRYINGALAVMLDDAPDKFEEGMMMNIRYNGKNCKGLVVDPQQFLLNYLDKESVNPLEVWKMEWDYAYAITCHKAQGSEWDRVFVKDDKLFKDDPANRKRWLYTAVTRAKNKLWLQA